MNPKRPQAIQILRHAIQLIAFLLFPQLFVTVLHALGRVVTALTNGTFSFQSLSAQLITIAVVFFMTAIWGRFFCGYLCSFGALQEVFSWLSQCLSIRKRDLPPRLHQMLGYLKYLILLFIVIAFWIMSLPLDASWNPWGIFGMLTSGNLSIMASALPTVGFILLLALLIGSLLVDRFFCRYFCPLGALFTIVSAKRYYKIQRNSSACINCGLCEKHCSMKIPVLQKEAVSSGNCIDCMQCLTICPTRCLSTNPAPAIAETAAAVTMCGLIQIGNLTATEDTATSQSYQFDTTVQGNYIDGVYTGVGTGFRGETQVQVAVEKGYITDITVLSYEDDAEFFQKAQSSILQQILSEQSVDVQTVSGATFSSNGILEAVADALDIETQSEANNNGSQLEEPRGNPNFTAPEDSQQSEQAPSDTVPDESAAASLDLSTLADGTYQGSGEGFRGTTLLSVTVESGKITDITVISYEDDAEFFSRAENTLLEDIITAQSLDVQTVSGATFSSNGILEAVANALNVEFDNPNQSTPHKGGHDRGDFSKRNH